MKIVIINHTFQLPRFYKRWELFARSHPDWEVTLIAPKKFKWDTKHSLIFGGDIKADGYDVSRGNFKIISVKVKDWKIGWISSQMVHEIKKIAPDIIYHIGGHTQLSLVQCAKLVKNQLKQTMLMAFSMRGPAMNIIRPKIGSVRNLPGWMLSYMSYLLRKRNLKYFNKYVSATVCHYPDAIDCFRQEGYCGPIYMSTQVGVDADVYCPDEAARKEIRDKYSLGDSIVFGTAVRFLPMKGLHEIIEAMPSDGNWKLLIMGTGDESFISDLKRRIKERGLEDKVILTGYIEWDEIAKYWNAIDCCLHVPRTTAKWEETFSLAVVQAMATAKPVIGNTSGSVPYQLGPDGIIVPEGDIPALNAAIRWVIENPAAAKEIGKKMYDYAVGSFEIRHLNEHFSAIISDVLKSKYSEELVDMTRFKQ